MKKTLPLISCIVANIIFGTTLYAIKMATGAVGGDSYKLLAMRFVLGVFVMSIPVVFGIIKPKYKGKPTGYLFLVAIMSPVLSFSTEAVALQFAPSSQFGIMTSLTPVVMTILSVFILREIPSAKQFVYMVLSVVGILVINTSGSGGDIKLFGTVLIIINMAANSLYKIYIRKLKGVFNTFETTYLVNIYAAAIFTTISLSQHLLNGSISTYFNNVFTLEFALPTIYLGIGATIGAMSMINYATSHLPIAVNAAISNLGPIVSILMGVILLGEPFRMADFIGTVIILFSILSMSLLYSNAKIVNKDI